MSSFSRWIIPIMGFRESVKAKTGIEKLWPDLRNLVSPDLCIVTPRNWDDDLEAFAYFVDRASNLPARVMIIAYSWGCGVGFLEFARTAWQLGISIDCAVLCDPVYRSRLLPKWIPFNPLSVSPILRPVIKIPASVQHVAWVRQNQDLPAGHDLVAEDPMVTRIEPAHWVQAGHTHIDDSAEFQALVRSEVFHFVSATGERHAGPDFCRAEAELHQALYPSKRPINEHPEWEKIKERYHFDGTRKAFPADTPPPRPEGVIRM